MPERNALIDEWVFRYRNYEVAWPGFVEILKLEEMLKNAGIPYEKKVKYGGWIIIYGGKSMSGDVIEHCGSYGRADDLLEAYGFDIDPEVEGDIVVGSLTKEEAFEYFKRAWEKEPKD